MLIKKFFCGVLSAAALLTFCSCTPASPPPSSGENTNSDSSSATASSDNSETETSSSETSPAATPLMKLIGHASVKLTLTDGRVVYIDPAYKNTSGDGTDYDTPADVILVTHGHDDHNQINLVKQKENCTVITYAESLIDGDYKTFDLDGLKIEAVPAQNSNHNIKNCVGYVLTFDGITLYHAGDTSELQQITDLIAPRAIDYALYPIDGRYNMNAKQATEFADKIGAKHNIPIHISSFTMPYDEEKAKTFAPEGALYVPYGDTIELG